MSLDEYVDEFKEILMQPNSCQTLYKSELLNHKQYYSSYAKCLLDMPNGVLRYFDGVQANEIREASYKVESHCGFTEKGDTTQSRFQWEEREGIAFYNYFHDSKQAIKILDYQVPLKNTTSDKEKAVDLLGTDGKDLIIFEYKRFVSEETLLRSLLEIYTYKKLLKNGEKKFLNDYNCENGQLIPAVIFMEDSVQHQSFKNADPKSVIRRLFRELKVRAYLIKPSKPFVEDDNVKQLLAMEKPELDFDMKIVELDI